MVWKGQWQGGGGAQQRLVCGACAFRSTVVEVTVMGTWALGGMSGGVACTP